MAKKEHESATVEQMFETLTQAQKNEVYLLVGHINRLYLGLTSAQRETVRFLLNQA